MSAVIRFGTFLALFSGMIAAPVVSSARTSAALPAPPADPGFTDSAPAAKVPAFVDSIATNQRGDARFATLETNAGVRVVSGFLALWRPRTLKVDAGISAPARDCFAAITPSDCTGLPGKAPVCGMILNHQVLAANVQYVVTATRQRTAAQAEAAYFDDRRAKGYSVTDGLGPLTAAWRSAAQQVTTITQIPADATTVLYNDKGNNTGTGSHDGNRDFGEVVDFLNEMGNNASTEPAKRFYKYARPYRWRSEVAVVPALVPAESPTPATDGGFISGHTAEAVRDALTMAWLVPERYQEMVSRGMELGESRIVAGMHSPLDVMGGRMFALAVTTANLTAYHEDAQRAYKQAHQALWQRTDTQPSTFLQYAHAAPLSADRFADPTLNRASALRRMTFGFAPIASRHRPAVVPKGAEILLETRFPYLSAMQRRVVLKTTALSSGYPILDDAEGWGRLNIVAAADGYGQFTGNVQVMMDAEKGGFNQADSWRNAIGGLGKLTLQGSGTLRLLGANRYSGGTEIEGGVLEAGSASALGVGEVYVGNAGSVRIAAATPVRVKQYSARPQATLELDIDGQGGGRLNVKGPLVAGGTLLVKFVKGYHPKAGTLIPLIEAGSNAAHFGRIIVEGYQAQPVSSATRISIKLL
ncbi:phosphatase PAP2 family protein [Pantoea allii]|uniref:phosphatase PAP2 family protein n=1 Tax=Pantoea allii TaxID=574096 RepID=UPI0039778F01